MTLILHTGLHNATLQLLEENLKGIQLEAIADSAIRGNSVSLQTCGALLIGEESDNPVRLAQEAFSKDKGISVLIINDKSNHQKVKQALQFAPFVGPTIQTVSNELGAGLVPIIEDSLQRTEQRRNYVRIRSSSSHLQSFSPNYMEKVRVSYMTRVLDEAPIGAALLGKDGTVLNVNAYILRLLGLTDKEILGIQFSAHFSEPERNALQDFITDGYHSKDKRTFELVQGEARKFLEISIGDIDANSNAPYKIAIVNDVTSATEAQQHTLAHLEELQTLNEELRRVNEDLDTFVYTASHDLKSPILNIEGLVNLLEETLDPQQAEALLELEHIRRSVERFKSTIEDLTKVARLQRNMEQEASELDVVQLAADVQQLLKTEVEQSGAEIHVYTQEAPTLNFSRKNFKSILLNLLSNAIKYRSPDRTLQIHVRTSMQNGFFVLTVQDNGLGIPAGKQERVFQLFKRMHVHVQGSGVGLYIVKRIVNNSGGTVQVESKENVGTTFSVSLPIV
ncbi:PAS domain-containing sensor histidine kinase [uncultured Pontibacter sp.]|uniref:sensor histidine kinase n=1 Tax=uncultured Pontibacter sp. TaxID=453356 RepID=UPI00261D7212|nr:PAS domain-containing sensor histidine kinase [uncultured Pontibacter sp.]